MTARFLHLYYTIYNSTIICYIILSNNLYNIFGVTFYMDMYTFVTLRIYFETNEIGLD